MSNMQVALITGGAKRLGACITRTLHTHGMHVIVHYRQSSEEAKALCKQLNQIRAQSAVCIQANLNNPQDIPQLIALATATWGRLDVVINNAASFHHSPLKQLTHLQWNETLLSNLSAPFFLSMEAAAHLKATQGCIINMVDIRAMQPLKHYSAYCISKAGLVMATKSLALEWAPDIRVNAIAPGVVLWPDEVMDQDLQKQEKIIARTPLKRVGTPEDIAKATLFLIKDAPYITGQVLAIDGGRSFV